MAHPVLASITYWLVLAIVLAITTAPVWVPALMIVYQGVTAKKFGQFSMQFLLALMAAECATLAINVTLFRCAPGIRHFLESLLGGDT